MRVSRAQAEQNRQTVINTASRLFREHGFDGIGLKDLMKNAGLTQGGFYKQFESKEDLIVQASSRAMEMSERRWMDTIGTTQSPLEALLSFYLSSGHRADKAEGCPFVALGADASRQGPAVKACFETGIEACVRMLGDLLAPSGKAAPEATSMTALSVMVGAVVLARAVNDEALAQGFLETAANEIRTIAARSGVTHDARGA